MQIKLMAGELAAGLGHVGKRTNQGSRIDHITEKPDLLHQLGTNFELFGVY